MNGTVESKRKFTLWVAVALVAVTSAGVAAWMFRPASKPLVSIPERVCAKSLPGKAVTELLPKRGKEYRDYISGADKFDVPHTGPAPDCDLSGGGRWIRVKYNQHLNSDTIKNADKAKEQVAREGAEPGSVPLRLGDARGYAWKHAAVLHLDCPEGKFPGIVEVSVDDRREFQADSSDAEAFAALAADTLRLAGRKVYRCEGAASLPEGPPQLGTPRRE